MFVCFILFVLLCSFALLEVAICRIILKILCGVILGVIIALTNDLHMGWTLFGIGVIIYLSEKEFIDKVINGEDGTKEIVYSAIDDEDDDEDDDDERCENDLIKLEEMLNNINCDIDKLNFNLKESKYKEIKCKIYKGLSLIEELLENNYELNYIEYDENKYWIHNRYSMIYVMVQDRMSKLPTPEFQLKKESDKRKLKEKIKTRMDNMLTEIYDEDNNDSA